MLAGTAHTFIWLLMKQTSHVMLYRNSLHSFHNQLIMVYRNIGSLINRRQLMLCGCYLIVLRFCRNTQFPQFLIQVLHVGADTLSDNTKIVIFHLLSLRSGSTKQSTACKHQVFSLQEQIFIHQEIFLLCTYAGSNLGSLCIAK